MKRIGARTTGRIEADWLIWIIGDSLLIRSLYSSIVPVFSLDYVLPTLSIRFD